MPFTPYHFGPGSLVKTLLRGRFSLSVFIFSQVVIDLETLKNILTGNDRLHTFFHTFLGVTLLIPVITIMSKYGFQFLAARWSRLNPISWLTATLSATVGAYSHVLLDAVMHQDLLPFHPINSANPFLRIVPVPVLHQLCIVSGVICVVVEVVRGFKKMFFK